MSALRLTIVSIIRNEADIIETFVRHHAGVVSRMVFVLHRCIDNTYEILERLQAEGFPVEIHEETCPGYPKPEVLGERIAALVSENAAEWIIPLHADEFLTMEDGHKIGDVLGTFTMDRVYTLTRKTYVPTPEDDATESNPVKRIVQRRTPENSPVRGILIPTILLKTIPWKLSSDRQSIVRSATGDALPVLSSAAIGIAHFPVRTSEQFTGKILGGWVALAANPGADPRRSAQWHGLVERCISGRPLSLGELRNIALRYGMPEGTLAIPGLLYDALPTATHRPQFLVRSAHPLAVLMDSAIASARSGTGRARSTAMESNPLMAFLGSLTEAIHRLRKALEEIKTEGEVVRKTQEATGATACTLLLLSAASSCNEPLTGSALTRRQKLGSLLAGLPPEWQWIRAMLQENKLPFSLESAIQELVKLLQAQDYAALRQQCRKESASDDIVLTFSQRLTPELRSSLPATLGTFLAQATHALLMEEADIPLGMVDPRVQVIHLETGRGELACETLRRMVNAGIEYGANPDMLRRDILNRTTMQESSSMLRSILAIRVSVLLQALRMPLGEGETIAIHATLRSDLKPSNIPIIYATIDEDDSTTMPADAEEILRRYVRVPTRNGMERDAAMSAGLRGIARVHALLKTVETGLGAVIAPRSLLHEYIGSGMREALLEDFEQIRILDLHGNPGEASDDEAIDGADRSGMCIVFLVRATHIAQKTLFMEWKGLKLQKYHALLSRGILDLPWKVIAPEKPGYVFLGM
ncbi:MAG: hypothetical protein Greene101449_1109 [Candidatus Peregrinibacteria bacterium Greene1014_49]|nr:MAG: hypothetical protein Greene101449_1109 [Candidatus Peregrinibacteria bacterium Greene1014_49]